MSGKHPATLVAERAWRELRSPTLQRFFATPGQRECSPAQAEKRARERFGDAA